MLATLFNPTVVIAYSAYTLSIFVLMLATTQLSQALHNTDADKWLYKSFSYWCLTHIGWPLIRVLALLAFIFISHPVLFELRIVPQPYSLLSQRALVINVISLMFVISLLLPLLPTISRLHALILPLQGCSALAILFNTLSTQQASTAQVIPDGHTLAALVGTAFIGHSIAHGLANTLGKRLDHHFHKQGFDELIYQTVLMLVQAPCLVIYAHFLVQQL